MVSYCIDRTIHAKFWVSINAGTGRDLIGLTDINPKSLKSKRIRRHRFHYSFPAASTIGFSCNTQPAQQVLQISLDDRAFCVGYSCYESCQSPCHHAADLPQSAKGVIIHRLSLASKTCPSSSNVVDSGSAVAFVLQSNGGWRGQWNSTGVR